MSNKKVPYPSNQENGYEEKLPDINSTAKASYIEKMKDVYLPDARANHRPSEESIEQANGLNSSKPNPVEEAISTNGTSK